ncbi:MAG: adenylate/guanylate cyclase domain-containing protein [Deltaproteobacteria bacterium]|jgi:class 3 adenylate cyclase|nr:adenylate/guanylate cyclase domain-containing protein [Deltaproteobacteria bacterium]MBW2536650.1 adenylate/guanylate cyclase domain-containing protein [Deltaproteobacteria bacterium]
MQPLVLLAEVAWLSAVACVLHALRPRFGLAPLYVIVGLYEAFLFVAWKAEPAIVSAVFGAEPANVAYLLFLPPILTTAVLVYVLECTKHARQLLAALIAVYLLHGAVDVIIEYHATHPPPGHPYLGDIDLVWYSMPARGAAMLAMIGDYLVIIIGYQFLRNRLPKLPLMAPILLATVAALVCDSIIFSLARGRLFSWQNVMLVEKLQTGVAAAIPVWLYIAWQLHKHRHAIRHGLLEREALELVRLRQKVEEVEGELEVQRAQLSYVKDTFSRYVSPGVVNAIVDDPRKVKLGGELRYVTVLFADIRGYSTLSESLSPPEIVAILNRYFQRVTDIILAHGGMINEFEGDAVLAVFGAPLKLDRHGERAVKASAQMLAAVEDLNREWEADGTSDKWQRLGIDAFSIRIGVHSGPVVAGNIGSTTRIKYAVIGDTVNTASRVEGLNKRLGTRLLASEATRRDVEKGGAELPWVAKGEHAVAGRTEPVKVFTLEGVGTIEALATPSERGDPESLPGERAR